MEARRLHVRDVLHATQRPAVVRQISG
jgi:hypothetical protein